jgi:hypothetical protein
MPIKYTACIKHSLFFIFAILSTLPTLQGQDIIINEFMSDNETGIIDEDGEYGDWIELFNNSDNIVDLSTYSLSDDMDDLGKWVFPDVTLNSYGFLVVFASSKNRLGNELHTNFKISSEGENIILSKNGIIIDQMFPISLDENISYGRLPDASFETYELYMPTPGNSNNSNDQLSFSYPCGFYDNPFYQKVESLTENEIRFTRDGSLPTSESTIFPDSLLLEDRSPMPNVLPEIPTTPPLGNDREWQAPSQTIDKAHVLRYASFHNGIRTSRVYSHSYFVNDDIFDKYDMPVISLVTEAGNFFDADTGIYVPGVFYEPNNSSITGNYIQRGIEWEREVHISYFEEGGNLGFSQNSGIRISGGYTRIFAQKSLRLYARDSYGEKYFNYPLFPQKTFDEYENFTLRTTMGARSSTVITDEVAHEVVRDMDMDFQDYRPVAVFLNGEYWGIHTIKDRLDEKYIEYKYGIDRDAVEIHNLWDNANYTSLITYLLANSLSDQGNYEYVESLLDIDNYLDYQISEMFLNNFDWPTNNVKGWRSEEYNVKWRWIFFDIDTGFGDVNYNMFEHCINEDSEVVWPNPPVSTLLFRRLLENDGFKQRFIQRYAELLNDNFQTDIILQKLLNIKELYEAEIPNHIERWNFPESVVDWDESIYVNLIQFAKKRPCIIETQIKDFFNLDNFGFTCETIQPDTSTLSNISIYPNPSNGLISIRNESESFIFGDIIIYNSLGQQMFFKKELVIGPDSDESIDLSRLPNNIYFLKFHNEFSSETHKIEVAK